MEALLAEPRSPTAPPEPAEPQPPARTCANCGAALEAHQDWCLECGSAVPGRLRTGIGWRMTATVVAVTLLLVVGAGAAAYAALKSPSKHATTKAAAVTPVAPATPAPATPPPAAATPNSVTPPITPAPTPNAATPAPTPAPAPATPTPAPAPTPAAPSTPTTTHHTTKHPATTTPKPAKGTLTPLLLDANAASTYNPNALPPNTFGDPSLAVDGDTTTAWTAQVDPTQGGKLGAGLALNLNSPQTVRELDTITATPGMDLEIYGTTAAALPATITDPAWVHLASKPGLARNARIKLATAGKRFRNLLLYIPAAPAGATQVSIAEVSVLQ